METFALKLLLTPALIGAASLAGRRWGPAVSGWLVGLPFTSAPIAFFLALNQGTSFAATAAAGTMGGTISQAAFCVIYAWLAARGGWLLAVAVGSVAFAISTVALDRLALSLLPLSPDRRPITTAPPRWDLPARMLVATAFVLVLTGVAPSLGARLTGLLAPFPLYAAVLAGFAHHAHGPSAATRVLSGVLLGLFAFVGFFFVLAVLIDRRGIVIAFAAAIVVALTLHAGSLWALRRDGFPRAPGMAPDAH
ncbi:MAG: hypothetical protein DMD81_11990 [Candidatus Rokuibacteriota bacterium]|nr:MAG: hypothetical protein DMD81_11990 [Candidatus Rokubacteria bacterium]